MRVVIVAVAVLALAAAPCVWDINPSELPAIVALFR
jgi:hypothetical protein